MCSCNYCKNPCPFIEKRRLSLPIYIRFNCDRPYIAVLLNYQNETIRMQDGKTVTSLAVATTYALKQLGYDFHNKSINDHMMWLVNILNVGHIPLADIKDELIVHSRKMLDVDHLNCIREVKVGNIPDLIIKMPHISFGFARKTHGKRGRPLKREHPDSQKVKTMIKQQKIVEVEENDEDDEDDEEFNWNTTCEKTTWTTNNLETFLIKETKHAPLLLKITGETRSKSIPFNMCNPQYFCIFKHPNTREEISVKVNSTILHSIPQYNKLLLEFMYSQK